MAGNSPYKAVQNFLDPLKEAISCITNSVIVQTAARGSYELDAKYALYVGNQTTPMFSVSGSSDLLVETSMNFRIIRDNRPNMGPFRVTITAYNYMIMDAEETEILAYHWHSEAGLTYPHLHVTKLGKKYHLPTGRVSLEQVIRLLLNDFQVQPRKQHWSKILNRTQTIFERYRSWV